MLARLNKKFRTIQPEGYFIRFTTTRNKALNLKHYFCGKHEVASAQCPNCHKPFLRFVCLDTSDERLQLRNRALGVISLFFCWSCNVAQGDFYYECLAAGEIKILKYRKGGILTTGFPYETYPLHFPGCPATLIPIPDVEQQIMVELNADTINGWIINQLKPHLNRPGHQIGGEPYLLQQELRKLRCPKCRKLMPFFATIGDNAPKGKAFTGNSYVQVIYVYCESCNIMSAYQECD